MKAKIDNRVTEVQIINEYYNEHAVEVKIAEGLHKGNFCIVEKKDLVKEKKQKKFKMSNVEYHKGVSMSFGEYKVIWAATIGEIELASHCNTKKEAREEARVEIDRLNTQDRKRG